jgi:sec-independent protein translocase protein TatA
MGGFGGPELLVIFVVVLLVFGPRKIPEVARGLGRVAGEVRRLTIEFQRELNLAEALEEGDKGSRRRPGGAPAPPAVRPAGTLPADLDPDGPQARAALEARAAAEARDRDAAEKRAAAEARAGGAGEGASEPAPGPTDPSGPKDGDDRPGSPSSAQG